MGETGKSDVTGIRVLIVVLIILSIALGYVLSPYIYKYLYKTPFYTCFDKGWSLLCSLGIGVPEIHSWLKSAVPLAKEKTMSVSFVLRCFVWTAFAFGCFVVLWASFVIGISARDTSEKKDAYEIGVEIYFDDFKADSSIYIKITLEDGSEPQDRNCKYVILDVQPQEPSYRIILDFPRYIIYRCLLGAEPVQVIVRPVELPDVIIRFSDPLVSQGDTTIMWEHTPYLLGNLPVQASNEFSPYIEYSYDGIEWEQYEINNTQMNLPLNRESVYLRWRNTWDLSHRDVLNCQKHLAQAGNTIDFYYPDKREIFNLDMLHNSKTENTVFLNKLKTVEEYCLSLESLDAQKVQCDKDIKTNSKISDANLQEPPCLVKIGTKIVYHCYDGQNALGYYHIKIDNEDVVWEETTLGQGEVIVLRLDMD